MNLGIEIFFSSKSPYVGRFSIFYSKLQFFAFHLKRFPQKMSAKALKGPSLARSVPKPLKAPSLARSVPKPLKVPSLARSVPKPFKWGM